MLLIYGEVRKYSREASRLYRERFPDRRQPSRATFFKVEAKLRTGSFPSNKPKHRPTPARTEKNLVNVLASTNVNPQNSIRKIAEETNLSKSTVQRVLKQYKYHPYKLQLVQGLNIQDFERRLEFIALINVKLQDNPQMLEQICWSDESRFHNNGVVNKHNAHYWSVENPHWIQETEFQTMWGINVWCAVFNGHLIGPHFYEGTLNGE